MNIGICMSIAGYFSYVRMYITCLRVVSEILSKTQIIQVTITKYASTYLLICTY